MGRSTTAAPAWPPAAHGAPGDRRAAAPLADRPALGRTDRRVLVLSSSLLVDRMLAHTGFLRTLSAGAAVDVWATSAGNPRAANVWRDVPAEVRPMPPVDAFRQLWHNYPRRLVEAVWDYRQREPSRLSLMRHRPEAHRDRLLRAIDLSARLIARLRQERRLERLLERHLLAYERCHEATATFRAAPPDVVLATGPFQFEQPAVVASAQRSGVRTLALIPSWDNVSTKKRMIFRYDGYIVWSEKVAGELRARYPHTRTVPIHVVGAPQFDAFFQPRFHQSRADFCRKHGLRPDRPIVLYAVGSPNFLRGERHGAIAMARAVAAGALGDVQLLVRPHPIHDNAEMERAFAEFGPAVQLQRTAEAGTPLTARSQDHDAIADWVSTFRHADVVVNLSSTVVVDAALCDRPIVNLDFDPAPDGADTDLVREINRIWTHFGPVAQSGGVWLVGSVDEMVHAVRTYLARPELHREQRRWIVEHVCQYADGRCGERMAEAVLDFVGGGGDGAQR
jgi:hypothetical protein